MSTKSPKRVIEITASVSAVIPTGNYENFKPMYSVKEIVTCNGDADEVISSRTDDLRSILNRKLQEDYERMRLEQIKKTRADLRFYERGGRQYPSVTTIINGIEPIQFDPDKLKQYASRGSLVHSQIAHFFKSGAWEADVLKVPGTKLDHLIVTQGSLQLSITDPNFPAFWEKHSGDFNVTGSEVTIFNDEYLYAGTADLICEYKGKKSIADFKTGSDYGNERLVKYFQQMAAYAKCLEGIEQIVVIPLNPSNKCGYGAPIVETDIDRFFTLFLNSRAAFKDVYGV